MKFRILGKRRDSVSSREKEEKDQVQGIKSQNGFSLLTTTLGVSVHKSDVFKLQKKIYF